jgi:asparagine synthase (glutamine-hydrolysing)
MDSSTIAATAHKVLSKGAAPFDLRAFTVVYDHLIPDEERYYSGLVAAKLDIPIHYLAADAYRPYDRWDRGGFQQPEPCHAPMAAITVDQYQQAAVHSRVMLTGEGGDVILRPSFSYLLNLLRSFKLGRVINDVSLYVLKHRRFPRIGFRTRLKNWLHKPVWEPAYPHWLNPDFESRLNLKERWKQVYAEPPLVHPNRPEAYGLLTSPFWASQFETYDPEFTKSPVEVRHPLFDLRLVNYLLALPSMPWGIDKELMRVAMRDRLPELVRLRRKAPLAGDPVVEIMKRENDGWIKALAPAKQLNHYVRWGAVTKTSSEQYTHDQMWINLQPISLNYWLQTVF